MNQAFYGLTVTGVIFLVIDAALVFGTAAMLVWRFCREEEGHLASGLLRIATVVVFLVISSVWIGSAFRDLGPYFFLSLHCLMATGAACLWCRGPGRWYSGIFDAMSLFRVRWRNARFGVMDYAGLLLIGAVLVYAFVLSAGTFAGNADSQTYRLARVGNWLQEGGIRFHFANNNRLLYMPINTECFMLWLTGFFPFGYPLVKLAQFFGGLMAIVAIFEMGRLAGLPRGLRFLAVAFFLGMPNAFLQFATSQSDLFTTGLMSAGLVFVWRCLKRIHSSDPWFAGLAIGLAVGAKSTVAYWIPAVGVWIFLAAWVYGSDGRLVIKYACVAAVVALVVGGWKYVDNVERFHNPFAPASDFARINQHSGGSLVERTAYVARIHSWQLFQPNSNPLYLAPLVSPVEQSLGRFLEKHSPNPQFAADFHFIESLYRGDPVYEDIVSFGIVVPVLALVGWILEAILFFRNVERHQSGVLCAAGVALGLFFLLFFTQQKPNAWNYRFFLLAAPFACLLAGSPFKLIWRRWRIPGTAFISVVFILQLGTAYGFQSRNVLGGWKALVHPDTLSNARLFRNLQRGIDDLSPADREVAVALPGNGWLTPYFRNPDQRDVHLVSLATVRRYRSPAAFLKATRYDALITRPNLFPRDAWAGTRFRLTNLIPKKFSRVSFELGNETHAPQPQ